MAALQQERGDVETRKFIFALASHQWHNAANPEGVNFLKRSTPESLPLNTLKSP